ncbi:hypothetical protein [Halorubrum sp. DTA98]|uniref:hypothetical protein n=1 Tax=Halorubrum sp. DTA98 TaxID=3402163 RepID=UPI003AB08C9B
MNRRRFIQGLGASAAAGVGLAHSNGPVQESEAIFPAVVAGGAAAKFAAGAGLGGVGLGWALREFEVLGSNPPTEGLTPETLHSHAYEAGLKRSRENQSTIIDNGEILKGVEHTAYIEGKIDAIEKLNEQVSLSEVQAAAESAVDDYQATVEKNLLSSWNETINELTAFADRIGSHEDLTLGTVYNHPYGGTDYAVVEMSSTTEQHTLPDGSTMDLLKYTQVSSNDYDRTYNPKSYTGSMSADGAYLEVNHPGDGDRVDLLHYTDWNDIYTDLTSTFDGARDGLALWVESVYSDVQSGELELSDLITPREQAAMMAEEESMAQAIADLAALNIPTDVEREATISLSNIDARIRGSLALTSDQAIVSGETYTPSNMDGDVYLTYDVSLGEGTWSAYDTNVDGGLVTFTEEPFASTIFRLETTAGETVELVKDDFDHDDSAGVWETNISDDVENAITEVDEVRFFADVEDTQYETIKIENQFTVEKIENTSTGDEEQQMNFESTEPQDDTNYITQEEWDDLEQQNQELIEKYEDSQSSGGLGLGGWDVAGVPGEIIIIVAAALAALGLVNN